ncbi:TetR family transcriptional regulator [Actinocorallia sp. A-T 12471]|uniref:TetR family transcriptional regulator n=1 Tax=Actinocorallia sp. A-T 12471 TaxID=3089813 RepID=UPI0029CF943E|nr:TetR family transcriptional regulator [Actinocorallia sp. A-T 12471]MDX6742233.1 TetR family transcriptional regulator [Actinocorallia sp. A-T 12471]
MLGEGTSRRDAQRIETRQRVFDAAVAEFRKAGVTAADIGAIAAAAGVARGTFYFHFPTKEHVVAEVVRREERRVADGLVRFLAVPHDLGEVFGEIVRLVLATERRVGKALFREVLALYFSPTRPDTDDWAEHPVMVLVIGEIARARERGEVRQEADPAHSGYFFFLGLYALLTTFRGSKAIRAGLVAEFVAASLRGLEAR